MQFYKIKLNNLMIANRDCSQPTSVFISANKSIAFGQRSAENVAMPKITESAKGNKTYLSKTY